MLSKHPRELSRCVSAHLSRFQRSEIAVKSGGGGLSGKVPMLSFESSGKGEEGRQVTRCTPCVGLFATEWMPHSMGGLNRGTS